MGSKGIEERLRKGWAINSHSEVLQTGPRWIWKLSGPWISAVMDVKAITSQQPSISNNFRSPFQIPQRRGNVMPQQAHLQPLWRSKVEAAVCNQLSSQPPAVMMRKFRTMHRARA